MACYHDRWRLHPPVTEDHVLPRFSSPDFAQEDLDEPFLDVVLQPGDVLYMPRGAAPFLSCAPFLQCKVTFKGSGANCFILE